MQRLVLVAVTLTGCGDNRARPSGDATADAIELTEPPIVGAQIDRMGRPVINTALNGLLDAAVLATAKKDAYNQAADSWPATEVAAGRLIGAEIAINLAILDIVDKGLSTVANNGCGNTPLYVGPPSSASYAALAEILVDDQLFLDSSKRSCGSYMAIEVGILDAGIRPHSECGGRSPRHDVVDVTYSLLAAGAAGFDPANGLAPRIVDGASVHADIDSDTFPFLGAPH